MGERQQSLRGTYLVPEAGGRSAEGPENGQQGGVRGAQAPPGPGEPGKEVAGEEHLEARRALEVHLQPGTDQALEAITMSRLSITERRPSTPTARSRRRRQPQELAKPKTHWRAVRARPGCCCEGFVWISPRGSNFHFCLYWPSAYWTERFLEDPTLSVTVPAVSRRLEELARPRRCYLEYFNSCRASPVWPIPRPTLQYRVSGRLKELATPQVRNNIWSINMSEVREEQEEMAAVQLGRGKEATGVTAALAPAGAAALGVPGVKSSPDGSPQLTDPSAGQAQGSGHPVSRVGPHTQTQTLEDYNRLLQLAMPKVQSEKCVPDRSPRWEVPDITKKAAATPRIISLAQPRVRKNLGEDYNPYYVSPASLVAQASPRLCELATPKSITKKV